MRTMSMTMAVCLLSASAVAQDVKPGATTRPAEFEATIAIEDGATPPESIRVYADPEWKDGKASKRLEIARLPTTGQTRLDLSKLPDGVNHVYFAASGFAPRWVYTTVADGRIKPAKTTVTLFQKRWVTIRYAFNPHGPQLTPDVAPPKTMTLTHWDGLPDFDQDWQIWQVDVPREEGFGPVPMLEFHRYAEGYGFASPPAGTDFDGIDVAPVDPKTYKIRNVAAEPGLMLICRVNGNRQPPDQLGYGKIVVESVSTTRPADARP